MTTTVTFEAAAPTFAVDEEARTITGIVLPFGAVSRPAKDATTGKASRYRFAEGTVTLPDPAEVAVVLNYNHDGESLAAQLGIATKLALAPEGVVGTFRVARTPEGDRALALAGDRIIRSFSAEVEGDFAPGADGVMEAKATTLTGAALAPKPAFSGAAITSVAASAAQTQGDSMTEENKETGAPSFSAEQGTALMEKVEAMSAELAALKDVKIPVGPDTAQFTVREEPIYRFAGSEGAPSGFDFATDLLSAGKDGDGAALARIMEFTAEHLGPRFADQPTTTGDTTYLNPSVYRPDMFLGQAAVPASPLYDCFHKGTLSSVTPFFWSKLDRTNTDIGVGDHTEDTEPETRDLVTATGATVTPTAVSGKVHVTREVADQGGNPQVSGLIWAEFDRSMRIALETKTAALIDAATISELGGSIAAGASGVVAGRAIEQGLVGLQFIADGFRFTRAFAHVDLYKALTGATIPQFSGDTDGEKLYPIINPANRDGVSGAGYSFIDIAGYRMQPAAYLGATGTVAEKSYVADPNAVHVWNSGLTRLDKLEETVAGWNLGVFAYFAGVVYDTTGLRKITYDPTA